MSARNPLSVVWERADASEPRFSADEVALWPEGYIRQLVEAGVICRDDNANTVVCDACGEGHVEEVVSIVSPSGSPVRAHIYCPDAGRVAVPLGRLKQWVVDFNGLTSAVTYAFELAGDVEQVVPNRIWFLGKGTVAAQSREIFLARGLTWQDGRDVLGGSDRLNAARSAVVFVAGEVPSDSIWAGDSPPIIPLKNVVGLGEKGLTIDRGHLEILLSTGRKKSQATPLVSFPTPAGTAWSDVQLIIKDNKLRVEAKGKGKNYMFQEAGFEERRQKSVPDRLWKLLELFAVHGGVLPFKVAKIKARQNVKHYVSDLRDRLIALMPGIDGDPISYDKDERAYRTAFNIYSKDGLKFPTPQNATWTDVLINKSGTSGIHISVATTERFAASSYTDEAEGEAHRWESAEREGTMERTYDLRTLGLADEQGYPNPAGQALLDVLVGRGTVNRRAEDKAMQKLCGVLANLMDIVGSPFEFAKFEEKWVALFDASGEP